MRLSDINDSDDCAECGTNLLWWINTYKGKVYIDDSETLFCSKKCFRNYMEGVIRDLEQLRKETK